MTVETRDLISILSIAVAILTMVIVSRNAQRATSVNAQNVDLARIRDLRAELRETKEELTGVRQQTADLAQHLTEANDRAISYARREAEMTRYARMPGVTIEDWLRRFDPDDSHEITNR